MEGGFINLAQKGGSYGRDLFEMRELKYNVRYFNELTKNVL